MRRMHAAGLLLLLLCAALRAAETPAVQVEFLDAEAARQVFAAEWAGSNEPGEPYFRMMMPLEMAAKTGAPLPEGTLEEQRAECRRRYEAAVREFTPEEQDALRWYASELSKVIDGDYPLLARQPWSFLEASDALEGTMPWTRGGHIILPAGLVAQLTMLQSRARTMNTLVAGQVLVHEQVHVLQRGHPGIFDGLYTGRWGFLHPDRIEASPWLVERQVLDPDALDLRWVFPLKDGEGTRYIWPRTILRDTAAPPRFPGDMRPVAVSVEPAGDGFRVMTGEDGRPVLEDLAGVKEYAEALAPSTYTISPNEASADIFCGLLVFDYFIPHERLPASYVERTEKELSGYRTYFRAKMKGP
jgi:hypothetical protein